jgi:hypothetical protein
MPLVNILNDFRADVAQCDILIANAHRTDANGNSLFPLLDRQQITVAAFLNLYVAWETFLERSLTELMIGSATLSGALPIRYVSPLNTEAARMMVIGVQRYFDYGNNDYFRRMVRIYFENGYPYEPHLSSISTDLADLRTMRNASAHITSTTQIALESLALRVLAQPYPGINLYTLLTTIDPRSRTGDTIFLEYKNKLVVAAELITQG